MPFSPDSRALLAPLEPFAGVRVLLGLSGGADSVALLRALLEAGAQVSAGHFNHQLRPEADADAQWVQGTCAALDVPCVTDSADVARVAGQRGWNLEAAARTLRYSFLARAARQQGAQVVLTAHTRGDQAETVLAQLLRGEGALTGTLAVRGHVRRPWLGVSRVQIEAYLRALGQPWREDASNVDTAFTRNWLRREILPLVRSRFPAAEAALARVAGWQQQDEALLSALASSLSTQADLKGEPYAILRRLVALRLQEKGLAFHATHLEALSEALRSGRTRHLTLPGGREVTATGGRLHLAAQDWPLPDFDYPPHWTLRHGQAGDRIRLSGGTRKVSDVLTDAHVPRSERGRVWLLAEEGNVRWLGLRPPVYAQGTEEKPPPWWAEMGEALGLARRAAGEGEVPVGAVVERKGQIIAGAHNASRQSGDMTRHAELAALREASRGLGTPYLTDCTLVVTLEPCPMCYGAALEARVGRVVYGAPNPKLGALGGVTDLRRFAWGHAPEIVSGVRAREASSLLSDFFLRLR